MKRLIQDEKIDWKRFRKYKSMNFLIDGMIQKWICI